MAFLARYTTFTTGQVLTAAELNGELNPIIQALTGAAPYNVKMTYNSSDLPTLQVDNTGSGAVASFAVSGSIKVRVLSTGVLQSTLATGTAPLEVASTTMVANLNADLLDGYEAADFVLSGGDYVLDVDANVLNGSGTGAVQVAILSTGATDSELILGRTAAATAGNYKIKAQIDAVPAALSFQSYDGAVWNELFAHLGGASPKLSVGGNRLIPYTQKVKFEWGQFFETPAVAKSGTAADYIYTASSGLVYPSVVIEKVYYRYADTGVGSGTIVAYLRFYNSAGTQLASRTITIVDADVINTVYSVDVDDYTMSVEGTVMRFEIGSIGGKHKSISFIAAGYRNAGVS